MRLRSPRRFETSRPEQPLSDGVSAAPLTNNCAPRLLGCRDCFDFAKVSVIEAPRHPEHVVAGGGGDVRGGRKQPACRSFAYGLRGRLPVVAPVHRVGSSAQPRRSSAGTGRSLKSGSAPLGGGQQSGISTRRALRGFTRRGGGGRGAWADPMAIGRLWIARRSGRAQLPRMSQFVL